MHPTIVIEAFSRNLLHSVPFIFTYTTLIVSEVSFRILQEEIVLSQYEPKKTQKHRT